jgi:hypothetical protein
MLILWAADGDLRGNLRKSAPTLAAARRMP